MHKALDQDATVSITSTPNQTSPAWPCSWVYTINMEYPTVLLQVLFFSIHNVMQLGMVHALGLRSWHHIHLKRHIQFTESCSGEVAALVRSLLVKNNQSRLLSLVKECWTHRKFTCQTSPTLLLKFELHLPFQVCLKIEKFGDLILKATEPQSESVKLAEATTLKISRSNNSRRSSFISANGNETWRRSDGRRLPLLLILSSLLVHQAIP